MTQYATLDTNTGEFTPVTLAQAESIFNAYTLSGEKDTTLYKTAPNRIPPWRLLDSFDGAREREREAVDAVLRVKGVRLDDLWEYPYNSFESQKMYDAAKQAVTQVLEIYKN